MADIAEVSREIRRAVDSGKVAYGFKQAEKTLLKENAELIIFSNNAPNAVKERLQEYATLANIPCYNFEGNGLELGAVCGKPFTVSVLSIKDLGKSKVLAEIRSEKKPKRTEKKAAKKKKEKPKK